MISIYLLHLVPLRPTTGVPSVLRLLAQRVPQVLHLLITWR